MAGGTFDPLVGKVRPGTYINFVSERVERVGASERGIVVIPLIGHKYGPAGEFIRLTNASSDAEYAKLGYSVSEKNSQMLLIRESFKKAQTVYVYILATGSKAAKTIGGLNVTAKYGGSRGNDFKVVIAANAVNGYDVSIYLGNNILETFEGVSTVEDLKGTGSAFVDFSGTGELTADAGTNLEGGTDGNVTMQNHTDFLDALESISFNALAYPVTGEDAPALKAACKAKIKYLIENVGKRVHAVIPDFDADYDGIINVTNSVKLDTGEELTNAQACAYVAALYAGATKTQSNTYARYDGAVDIVSAKTHEEAVAAIKNGEFFFSFSEGGEVVVESDINSLVTYGQNQDSSYSKNRVQRVFDALSEAIHANFPPNKYDNNETGWDIMEGVGRGILIEFENDGAITNVDPDNDFLVDRAASVGDQTFFNVGIQAVDSAEKLYFTFVTR